MHQQSDRFNPWERIVNIGGPTADGRQWTLSQAQAIADIEAGKWALYVEQPTGDRVQVVVATSAFGYKYLKTTADGDAPNNLLSLPECR